MNNYVYRVNLNVGYQKRYFEFTDRMEAVRFAETVLAHDAIGEDHQYKTVSVNISVVDLEREKEADHED